MQSHGVQEEFEPLRKQSSPASFVIWSCVILLIGSVLALWQYKQAYRWHEPNRVGKFGWFFRPLEWNIDSGLPQVPQDLYAVAQSRNGKCLWIAGPNAFLAYSADQSRAWEELRYDAITIPNRTSAQFKAPTTGAFPCADRPVQVAGITGFSIISKVYAAEQAANSKQPSSSSSESRSTAPNVRDDSTQKSSAGNPVYQTGKPVNDMQKSQSQDRSQTTPGAPQQINAVSEQKSGTKVDVAFNRNFVSFGKTQLDLTSTQTLQILNKSDIEVQLDAPTYVDVGTKPLEPKSPFTVTGFETSCGRLRPQSQCQFSVNFHPTVEGTSRWNLVVGAGPQKLNALMEGYATPRPASEVQHQKEPSRPAESASKRAVNVDKGSSLSEFISQTQPALTPPTNPDMRNFSITEREESVYSSDGWIFTTADSGLTWSWTGRHLSSVNSSSTTADRSVWELDGNRVTLSNESGSRQISELPLRAQPQAIFANSNGRDLWVAGLRGGLFHSSDAGHSWLPMTREAAAMITGHQPLSVTSAKYYKRFMAPWYLVLIVLCGCLLIPAMQVEWKTKRTDEHSEEEERAPTGSTPGPELDEYFIGNQGVSDKPLEPGEPDVLELGKIAGGLSFFLRNEKTKPPLVISINGRWGSGKSSLMNLLQKKLKSGGAYPVWFNAWHHDKEEQLLAALLQAVKQQAVPPLFALNGVRFRLNLLWKRIQKNWAFIGLSIALVYLVIQAETYLRMTLRPPLDLWKLLNYISHIDFSLGGDGTAGPLGWIAGIVTGYQILSRLLTAFGSKPETLLTTVSGAAKSKDKEAHTTFRMRFAQEFHDVTAALPTNQRMLILIDDLDRCRPEKVREVFESVNFLVSSGECFVVLGMARDMVEHYLGLSFRHVVEGLSWTALGLTEEDKERAYAKLDVSSEQLHSVVGRRADDKDEFARRWAFARLYLDKLVQIEITVPEPTTAQKRMLFDTVDGDPAGTKEKQFKRMMQRLDSTNRLLQPALKMTLIAAIVILVGFEFRSNFVNLANTTTRSIDQAAQDKKAQDARAMEEREQSTQNMRQIATGLSDIANGLASVGTGAPGRITQRTNQKTLGDMTELPQPDVPQKPAIRTQDRVYVTGLLRGPNISRQSGWLGAWPFLALLVISGGVFSYALRVTSLPSAEDTEKFTNALTAWFPLVLTNGAKNTPRMAKRFQNKVRYLAMRQRALDMDEVIPLGERWLRERMAFPQPRLERLSRIRLPLSTDDLSEIGQAREIVDCGIAGETANWKLIPGKMPEQKGPTELNVRQFAACITGRLRIPEPLLVAFSAVHEFDARWIQEEKEFEWVADLTKTPQFAGTNDKGLTSVEKARYEVLREAQTRAEWHKWFNLPLYRFAYLRLCSEVDRKEEKSMSAGVN